MTLVVPNLDGLQCNVQDVVCDHLTYDKVDAQHGVDALPDCLPDVHLDVVHDVLAKFSESEPVDVLPELLDVECTCCA